MKPLDSKEPDVSFLARMDGIHLGFMDRAGIPTEFVMDGKRKDIPNNLPVLLVPTKPDSRSQQAKKFLLSLQQTYSMSDSGFLGMVFVKKEDLDPHIVHIEWTMVHPRDLTYAPSTLRDLHAGEKNYWRSMSLEFAYAAVTGSWLQSKAGISDPLSSMPLL